jgi:NAD(P)-dependent dehydrogenase (short-subunit alcohol dehydrogenase family)
MSQSRWVLVTGTSTGIGRAVALHLDREGFDVLAGVRREADGEAVAAEGSGRIAPLILDVTDADSIAAAAKLAASACDGELAGLVNNAGIAVAGPVEAVPIDDFRHQLEVNLVGQVAVTQSVLPILRQAKGRVVFVSSVGGRTANPYLAAYHASKFGVEAVGDSLRQELRKFGMHVSIVEPGAVATPIWERGRDAGESIRRRFPDGAEELYGAELDRLSELSVQSVKRGIPPERVADAVLAALTAPKPKTRYLVGRDARLQATLQTLLPDRVRDRLVARFMGI